MSHEAQTWAIKIEVRSEEELRKPGTSGLARKAVLMYLANRANAEDGASWPSQTRVARELCCSERCVRDAMKDLERMGIIRRRTRPGTSDMISINFSYQGPAGDAGVGERYTPAPDAPAGDSAELDAGPLRHELPDTPERDAGDPRQELPPNLQEEPSSNRQEEPSGRKRKTVEWPEDYRAQFWGLYPKKPGDSRKEAWAKLDKVHRDDAVEFTDLMRGLKFYAERMEAEIKQDPSRRRFIAAAVVWLNQARWETEAAPERQRSNRRQTMAI